MKVRIEEREQKS